MQEEVENRTLTLIVSGTKFTGRLFKAAISKYMAHRREKKLEKQRSRDSPVTPKGKQTVKQLIGQNQGVSNIEINDPSIRDFERIARKYGVLMIEEATSNFNPALYGEIARRVETPLATGERFHTRWGFEQLLKQGAISVIQPDITNCGGLSEAKKICDLAHIYDVRVQCHVAGTPIAEAAAIQLEAAIPNFYIHETYHMAAHPDCVSYGKYAYVPENGYLTVPDLPGLGQELSDKAMAESLGHIEVR